jgi:exonuclease SbcD
VSLEHAPRDEEHARFLDWLLETMRERGTDVLVVAGDIFHYTQPSAAAQQQLFGFLATCATETDLKTVVLVAGNHDSPSRLEAPAAVLGALDVRVVGQVAGDVDEYERHLFPIEGESGEVEAVVVAVPYVSESRLGIQTADRAPSEVRADYVAKFTELYSGLAALAHERWPNVPLVATGHLTVQAPLTELLADDFHTPLHQFGTINGLGPDIFGDDYAHVALGHIHRQFQVGDSPAWYSGTPVPTSVVEARTPRYVLDVETSLSEPRRARVRPVKVPRWREVFELRDSPEVVESLLRQLTWTTELPPYVWVELLVDGPSPVQVDDIASIIATYPEPRPRLVAFRKTLTTTIEPLEDEAATASLDEMTPEEVFEQMFALRHGTAPDDDIRAAFRELLGAEEGA